MLASHIFTEGWIYTLWFDDGRQHHENLSAQEAIDVLMEPGYWTTAKAIDFLERVGDPDDLALEMGGVIGMNVTDMTGDPA